MTALCLAGGGAVVRLAVAAFTLGWSHTVEHTRWEEDWSVHPNGLRLETARVEGSGAGMDPGPDARRVGAMWVWHPGMELPAVSLRRAVEAGDDWRICTGSDGCQTLGALLPRAADPVQISACP